MKATGVVRRIDELGRIVLPKEMRKILKIKSGDNLEIFMSDGDIVLSKYKIFDDKKDLMELLVNSMLAHSRKNVIITDTSKIVAGSKFLLDKETIFGNEFMNFVYKKYPELKEENERKLREKKLSKSKGEEVLSSLKEETMVEDH